MPLEPFRDRADYARRRDDLQQRIVTALQADARVVAAWLSGSFGRGTADEWADLDLHVAIQDGAYEAFVARRTDLYAAVGTPILIQESLPSDSLRGGLFQLVVFEGCVEVDWNFGPLASAARPIAHRVLFERQPVPVIALPALTADARKAYMQRTLTFFWAMAPIAIKYCGRHETHRAVRQIHLLTEATITLSRLLAGDDGTTPSAHSANRPTEPEIDAVLPRIAVATDPADCLRVITALCALVESMHARLAQHGVEIPSRMPEEVARLAALARHGAPPGEAKPYR
jgi:hypothetical protein